MYFIPEAYTDCTPAAATYGNRLYIAFKDNNSDQIRIAYTENPNLQTGWSVQDIPGGLWRS